VPVESDEFHVVCFAARPCPRRLPASCLRGYCGSALRIQVLRSFAALSHRRCRHRSWQRLSLSYSAHRTDLRVAQIGRRGRASLITPVNNANAFP
jgi:hypothetical protein